MSKVFDIAYKELMASEGGYADDSRDPGGETYKGITRKGFPQLEMWKHIDRIKKEETNAKMRISRINAEVDGKEAETIFRKNFWDKCRCDEMPESIAVCVSDTAYHSGCSRAIKLLQKSVGANEDGLIGPNTLAVANRCNQEISVEKYCDFRLLFLRGLPTWNTYKNGWMARVEKIEKLAKTFIRN